MLKKNIFRYFSEHTGYPPTPCGSIGPIITAQVLPSVDYYHWRNEGPLELLLLVTAFEFLSTSNDQSSSMQRVRCNWRHRWEASRKWRLFLSGDLAVTIFTGWSPIRAVKRLGGYDRDGYVDEDASSHLRIQAWAWVFLKRFHLRRPSVAFGGQWS